MPTINIRKLGLFKKYDVLVDRTTQWGNPYVLGKDGTRSEVIAKHKRMLWDEIKSGDLELEEIAALDRKVLACWCAPLACHGDTLLAAAAWAAEQLNMAPEDRGVQT